MKIGHGSIRWILIGVATIGGLLIGNQILSVQASSVVSWESQSVIAYAPTIETAIENGFRPPPDTGPIRPPRPPRPPRPS